MPRIHRHVRRRLLGAVGAVAMSALLLGACTGSSGEQVATGDEVEPVTTPTATAPPATEQASPETTPTRAAPTVATVPTTAMVPTEVPATAVPDRVETPPTPPPLIGTGSEGAAVEDTQDLLNDLIGYTDLDLGHIAEDGVFGPNTDAAQRRFEAYAELPVDGVASTAERELLDEIVTAFEINAAESIVSLGDESPFVGTWQTRLNIWNDLVLELPVAIVVDNRFGPDTEAATLAVEEALGLQVDGIVEPEDRAALRAEISRVRAETDATVLQRTTVGDHEVLVRAVFAGDRYCLRFVVGFAADERCTDAPGGDLNTAFFLGVNGVSFVGGTANPNIDFVRIDDRNLGMTPVATRRFGNSPARGWVEIVAEEPDTVELLEADGSSVLELDFSIAPTDREFFGSTLELVSNRYSQTFFVDACSRPGGTDLILEASLAGADLVLNVLDDTGSLLIESGTEAAPVQIDGTITSAETGNDEIVVTGRFTGDLFDDEPFTATANC